MPTRADMTVISCPRTVATWPRSGVVGSGWYGGLEPASASVSLVLTKTEGDLSPFHPLQKKTTVALKASRISSLQSP